MEEPQEKRGEGLPEGAEEGEEAQPQGELQEEAEERGAAPEAGATYTYEELAEKTVAELRDMARGIEHDALRGYSTMHKEDLLAALCRALGVEAHAHHEVVGIDKSKIKARIRELKVERDRALAARDHRQLKEIRRRIRRLKRKIRKATV